MKLSTAVNVNPPREPFRLTDKVMLLGSCFADNLGARLSDAGFSVCTNPFGTLYNPESLLAAVRRLDSGEPFGPGDCVEMGAGAGRICSFMHHTSFARRGAEEFLECANKSLEEAHAFWQQAGRVVLTLGTALVWYHDGKPVANCLKRPASEFTRRMLDVSEISEALEAIVSTHPDKRFTVTVSPIRHLGDGAHVNALSKASLLLGTEAALAGAAEAASDFGPYEQERGASATPAEYFPAYEILNDELRDYRFYADDLVHPSTSAVQYIWERFLDTWVAPEDLPSIAANEKAARTASHRPNLR